MNKAIFATEPTYKKKPQADTVNEAGGRAYQASDEEALSQYALTGTIGNTFYASAQEQLDKLLELAGRCSVEYVAKTAIYAREKGLMKDTPVILLAHLFSRPQSEFFNGWVARNQAAWPTRAQLLSATFRKVVTDTKALRNFAQVIRSGVTGRKSFGSTAKRLMEEFLTDTPPQKLFFGSIGTTPTLGQVIEMVRPTPQNADQNSVFRWLIGKDATTFRVGADAKNMKIEGQGVVPPAFLKEWLDWNADRTLDLPNAPFEMLTEAAGSDTELWRKIAAKATWNQIRQSLVAFKRHGVFTNNKKLVEVIAGKISDPEQVARSRAFPFAIMRSYKAASDNGLPQAIQEALLQAVDLSLANIPRLPGHTYVFVDTSGSMDSPVTGERGVKTTDVSCREVASLYAAAIMASCQDNATVMCFTTVVNAMIRKQNSIRVTYKDIYDQIISLPSGGTNCAAPMAHLVGQMRNGLAPEPSTIIYLSDNQSWFEAGRGYSFDGNNRPTNTQQHWAEVQSMAPGARVIGIDLQPYGTVQVKDSPKVMNIGGFSNSIFDLIGMFAEGSLESGRLKSAIEAVSIM